MSKKLRGRSDTPVAKSPLKTPPPTKKGAHYISRSPSPAPEMSVSFSKAFDEHLQKEKERRVELQSRLKRLHSIRTSRQIVSNMIQAKKTPGKSPFSSAYKLRRGKGRIGSYIFRRNKGKPPKAKKRLFGPLAPLSQPKSPSPSKPPSKRRKVLKKYVVYSPSPDDRYVRTSPLPDNPENLLLELSNPKQSPRSRFPK